MSSLLGKTHGNAFLEDLYRLYEIGQISKIPGGNLRMKVKSKEACLQLERTKLDILGGAYLSKEFDMLGDKYFIDISNVDSDTDTTLILQRLLLLRCNPVLETFREVSLATGVTSETWRVYFLSSSCPSALIVNGSVCDQVLFENKLHPAHGKNALSVCAIAVWLSLASWHRFGYDQRCFPVECVCAEPFQHRHQHQPRPRTYAQAVSEPPRPTMIPQQTSLQKADAEAKTRDGQLQPGRRESLVEGTDLLTTAFYYRLDPSGPERLHQRSVDPPPHPLSR